MAICVKMTGTSCLDQQAKYDLALQTGQLGMDMRRPECDGEGDWAPVQCTGAGVCRCVSKEDGTPIFGLETNITAVDSMTCGCARQAETLRQLGCDMAVEFEGEGKESMARYSKAYTECMANPDTQYLTGQLRCDPNGNFDTAQCISQVRRKC